MALCYCSLPAGAQDRGSDLMKQAQECLGQKDYTKARYLFLQAYYAYSTGTQYDKAVACGVQASALYHRENYNQEAFELLGSVEQTVITGEQKSGKSLPALRYPITRERLQIYLKQRSTSRAKDQLARLENWAKAAQNDSLDTDLLYTQALYYYTFGMNSQGDAALNALINRYTGQKDYAKAEACYREMIGKGRRAGNTAMVARAYDQYMAWNDSVQALAAQEKYNELDARYKDSLQTIEEKDGSLAARQYVIVGLCILAAILAAALVLGGVILLRFVAQNRKQRKMIQTANEHNALKTKFIRNISAQMAPTLDTLDTALPAVQALKAFSAHIEELSVLEDTLAEPYELEDTNALTFCESLAEGIKKNVKEEVAVTVNAPKLSVKINREHVEKIIAHLLQNAAEHTPAGGKIWLDFKKRGAHTMQFIVTDTGCGIAEERQEDLFKPFTGVQDLTQGDGLGLPICALEATKMNGSLTLDSTYHKGARFVLELHA